MNNGGRPLEPGVLPEWDPGEVSWASPSRPEDDLLVCDVDWLIRKAIEYLPLDNVRLERGSVYPAVVDNVVGAFWHVHQSVSRTFVMTLSVSLTPVQCHWGHCRPVCKYWRTSILRVCKEQGWLVPGKKDLFRNRFTRYETRKAPSESAAEYHWQLAWPGVQDFVPPIPDEGTPRRLRYI